MILFFCAALLTLITALMVVLSVSPIYSVLALVVCFMSFALHYLLLGASFLAAVQVIVYAGAVMVLFLFTLMMMNLNMIKEIKSAMKVRLFGLFFSISFVSFLIYYFYSVVDLKVENPVLLSGNAKDLGLLLFKNYWLPFEIAGVLFLSAVVSVVMLGKWQRLGREL